MESFETEIVAYVHEVLLQTGLDYIIWAHSAQIELVQAAIQAVREFDSGMRLIHRPRIATMEPAEAKINPRFVIRTTIEDTHENAFLPKAMNEYFFYPAHGFVKGDKVKITIEKVVAPDAQDS